MEKQDHTLVGREKPRVIGTGGTVFRALVERRPFMAPWEGPNLGIGPMAQKTLGLVSAIPSAVMKGAGEFSGEWWAEEPTRITRARSPFP
jgi:hypothetical protein